ncbi:Planctomycete cytochrome C [Bremerella volcania]|uniref:Planctomycete cytochrome C n=1 Tax=Bremerella volcania TaxID=2527984 RepID=A0A518C6A0_9BACT|nr:c-type cytochrome domain-containing protein [Bremerella volcania]QDU74742.1 Planctomycete cytochrome C [Bremerella volcania]
MRLLFSLSVLLFLPSLLHAQQPVSDDELRASIQKALPLVEETSKVALRERACYTCHHGGVTTMAIEAARLRGFEVDRQNVLEQMERAQLNLTRAIRRVGVGGRTPGQADGIGWQLMTLAAGDWPADEATHLAVEHLVQYDHESDHWAWAGRPRPPTVASPFTTTWAVVRGVLDYTTPDTKLGVAVRVTEARDWLIRTPSRDTEESVSKLRTLKLVEADERAIRDEAKKLLEIQQDDGGWAQLPGQESDAYATSTVLIALLESEQLKRDDVAIQAGLRFLLGSQLEDGSWHVKKRAPFVQPHFETSFPHGKDQFISAVATAWSVYAMAQLLPSVADHDDEAALAAMKPENAKKSEIEFTPEQIAFFTEKVEPILQRRCYRCHTTEKEPKGDLALNSREEILIGGYGGPGAVPGRPDESMIFKALNAPPDSLVPQMPPRGGKLPQEEMELIKKWIEMDLPHRK